MLDRTIEWIARRERIAVVAGLSVIIVLAWVFLLAGGGMDTSDMSAMGHGAPARSGDGFAIVFVMWAVMMMAMMLPSAAPTILLFAALMRARASTSAIPPTGVFASGYVLVWTGFSVLATTAHGALHHAQVVSTAMRSTSDVFAGLLLVAAGVYQLTPVKDACLRRCRSPIQFLTQHWRPGSAGAFRLGLLHGGYCVGCCWALMALLFVGGVMNVLWVAAVAGFVLLEKTAFLGARLGRLATGAGLIAAGAVVLVIARSR